ncbi:MAG: hypothetical protein P4L40_00280 [Terracidiphilus sp.]|nr:hypothetical protein [Terracidiphilus sp.]
MTMGCAREKEVTQLLELGQWPQASPEELRKHAAGCRVCGERVLVTESLRAARATAMAEAQLPSAGALWWRAQLRRRNEALARVTRPMLGAQIFALAVAALLMVGAAVWAVEAGVRLSASPAAWLKELGHAMNWSALVPDGMAGGAWWWLAPVLAVLALAGGVAVYFATEKQ